jgi:hypothetical protein
MQPATFTICAQGDWPPGAVRATWAASTRRIVPEVERQIDAAWSAAAARLGNQLFDGPMCRLERWNASPQSLDLTLAPTSYRPFLGTNLFNAYLADEFGPDVLANPVGLSTILQTTDGWLLLGRRNDSVAYYPNRVHPFAGALEPADPLDVFSEVRRELDEELSLTSPDLAALTCIGLAQDNALRQPELIFQAITRRSRAELESTLDPHEHHAVCAIALTAAAIEAALADTMLTPVAAASLTLWAKMRQI